MELVRGYPQRLMLSQLQYLRSQASRARRLASEISEEDIRQRFSITPKSATQRSRSF